MSPVPVEHALLQCLDFFEFSANIKSTWLTTFQILRKHFGLEVFFATTRIADGEAAPWPSDPNYKWHLGRALQTTICYLTLPRRAPGKATFSADEMEADYRSSTINAAQSYFIEIPSQQNRDLRSKQFQRALRTLRLKPYIHASQLNFTVSAEARSVAGLNPGTTGIAKVEWPQLLMLVKANSNWYVKFRGLPRSTTLTSQAHSPSW